MILYFLVFSVFPYHTQDRRVSFADPIEERRSPEKRKKLTRTSSKLQPRRLENRGTVSADTPSKEGKTPDGPLHSVYPPLVDCTTSVDVLIPKLGAL